MKEEKRLFSLTEFTAWMAEHGVRRSRAEWYRRVQAGQFGHKVGSQWVVSQSEARRMLETFGPEGD